MGERLDGRVAVITGGAAGIGEATARLFVEHGARVVIADRDEDRGRAGAAELGDPARFAPTDVTSEADVEGAVRSAVDGFGRLDIMFNNAGIIGVTGPIGEIGLGDWTHTVDVLLHGVFLGTKHAARSLVAQGGPGSIISTASIAGLVGGLGPHAYTAAKHAVIGLTKSVANELAPHGIRVNAIAPGSTATPMTAAASFGDPGRTAETAELMAGASPLGYATLPEDIAAAALYLASDDARNVSGHTLVVDAGHTTAGLTPGRFNQ